MIIENPAKKNIRNMYLNDYNYFHKNSIRMYKKKKNIINQIAQEKKIERLTHPVPKMLYSTSDFKFDYKEINNKLMQTKPILDDLINQLDNFSVSLNSDDQENSVSKKKEISKKDFFITKPEDQVEDDTKNIKVAFSSDIMDSQLFNEVKKNDKNYKENLQLENFEKFKFSKTGVSFPNTLKQNELPEYRGNDNMEKEYFEYRKKLKYPNLIYNNIGSFNEKFNKDLGTISHTYGKIKSRGRFTQNPLLKKYMDMIPVYEIYKDIKYIENRYTDKKFKYKMLPLINQKLRNLDKLADKFYKTQNIKNGLNSLLNIENFNKIKK